MKRNLMVLMGFLLALLISTSAYAFGEGRGHGGKMDGRMFMLEGFKKLNLTADQKAKLEALKEECKKETLPLKEQMMAKRTELRTLWLEDNPNAEKIKAAQKEMSLLRDQMMDKMTTFRLLAHALLTPEQKAEVKNFCQKNFDREKGSWKGKDKGKMKGKDNK
ncbi:MAG: Spy/CpxP family protein refolding chaperone [Syntrophobacterales bacterium]|nr:Spy/CpxP family protein refolding chaperone [Syntrophobacterales bacterium]